MKIIPINVNEEWEQNYKREDFINKIIDHILMICKFDKNFEIDDLNQLDNEIEKLNLKINNKDDLISKSEQIKKSLINNISTLENENIKVKMNLLESLGCELWE